MNNKKSRKQIKVEQLVQSSHDYLELAINDLCEADSWLKDETGDLLALAGDIVQIRNRLRQRGAKREQ